MKWAVKVSSLTNFIQGKNNNNRKAPTYKRFIHIILLLKFCKYRKNVYDRQTLLLGNVQSVLQSNFNASWPVKMYAGGWPGGDGVNIRVRKWMSAPLSSNKYTMNNFFIVFYCYQIERIFGTR